MRKVTGIILALALIFVTSTSINAEGVNTEEDAFTFIPVLESLRVLTDGIGDVKFEVGEKEMPQKEEAWNAVYQDSDLLHGISFLVKELQEGKGLRIAYEDGVSTLQAGNVRVTLDLQQGSFVFLSANGMQLVLTDEIIFYYMTKSETERFVFCERGRTIIKTNAPLLSLDIMFELIDGYLALGRGALSKEYREDLREHGVYHTFIQTLVDRFRVDLYETAEYYKTAKDL